MSVFFNKQVEHWNKSLEILQDELDHSPSDRSCVIVAAAYIDELLGYIFQNFLSYPSNKKEDNELFSNNGPLSTFSCRILLSYRLGLISNYEYRALQTIRKIRNAFAHDISKDSLKDYQGALTSLVPPRQLLLIKMIPLPSSENDKEPPLPIVPEVDLSSARDMFEKIVLCLTYLLSARCLFDIKERRKIPSDFKSLIEIDNQRIGLLEKNMEETEHIIKLTIESIELHKQIIEKLSALSETENAEEIKTHQEEIEKLESEILGDYQEFKDTDTILSVVKYARDRIKKAFEKESLL